MTTGSSIPWVDDVMWARLAPEAAEADAAERRVTRKVGIGIALATLVVALVQWTGVASPSVSLTGGGAGEVGTHAATLWLEVRNDRLTPITIAGPGSISVPGLELVSVASSRVEGLSQGSLRIDVRATDCAVVAQATAATQGTIRVLARTILGDFPLTIDDRGAISGLSASMCDG